MRLSFLAVRALSLLVFLPCTSVLPSHAQTFPAITGGTNVFTGDLPDRVASAAPAHHKKTDAPLMYARIRDGIYSVDGMVGKVRLNYDVKAASYLYFFMPGVGTAVVSLAPAADAISAPAAFHDGELTLRVADHTWNLTGVESLVNDRGKEPAALYVRLDRASWKLARTPRVGFGSAMLTPYEWPGTLSPVPSTADAETLSLPMPANLLPSRALPGTSAGITAGITAAAARSASAQAGPQLAVAVSR